MQDDYIKKILCARVYDLAVETPVSEAPKLSRHMGNKISLKREDLQPVFSFKIRGAYNCMRQLNQKQRDAGVVAASAGNHAQGVALSARHLGIRAVIVMPLTTPDIKVDSVREKGGEVVLFGDTFDEACSHAYHLQQEKSMTFIHPYDDPNVIAGQGTVGVELMKQLKEVPDVVFIPVGGGGLAAGMSVYIKYVSPQTKVVAVEPEDAACLKAALDADKRVKLDEVGIFADGVAVGEIGEETFKLCREYIDEVVTVSTDEICAGVKDVFEATRVIAEPAGALALAGLKSYVRKHKISGQNLAAVVSGANTSFGRLRHISERTELGSEKEALFAVTIQETPGSFLKFCKSLGNASITEFNYRFSGRKKAHIFVGVELSDGEPSRKGILKSFAQSGIEVVDLTHDEMAKLHVRYMVGGHGNDVEDEYLYRVQFPEKPGALLKFLSALESDWNISLFHYRNHAAAYGRVLMGIQVPENERNQLESRLNTIEYPWCAEGENPAYKIFLS